MIRPEDVTIIIPHLGGSIETERSLNECVKSLIETAPNIRRIIARNGRECGVTEHMHFDEKPFDCIDIEEQGQCKAVNAAVATTNTPWIFVTNDDMIYPSGWFENLTSHMVAESIECISPRLVEPRAGAPTFLVEFCGGAGGDFDKQKFLDFVEKYHKESDGAVVSNGFNLPFLISRGLWDTIGGYDINFDPWSSNSDSDLLYKIKLAGVIPVQGQDTLVYHFSQTSGTFEPRNQAAWQRNWDYFIEKWGFPRTDDGIWEASFDVPNEGRKFRPDWEGKYGN